MSVVRTWIQKLVMPNASLLIGTIGGLLLGALILHITGANALNAYAVLFQYTWGSWWGINQVIQKMVPLSIVGFGLSIAFRSKIINIGGEGQILIGGIVGSIVALYLGFLPAILLIPLMLIAGFIGGSLWAFVPGLLRSYYKIDEVITTLMLNYVAFWLLDFLVRGPLSDPASPGIEQSQVFSSSGILPCIIPNSKINIGIIIVLLLAIFTQMLLWRTTWGYEYRAIGVNPEAAQYGGVNLIKSTLIPLLLSGGFAGLAGIMELSGVHNRLVAGFSSGYGFTAIAVALLGRLSPLGVLLSSLLFATLMVGGQALQYNLGIPNYISTIVQASIVIFIICGEALQLRTKNA